MRDPLAGTVQYGILVRQIVQRLVARGRVLRITEAGCGESRGRTTFTAIGCCTNILRYVFPANSLALVPLMQTCPPSPPFLRPGPSAQTRGAFFVLNSRTPKEDLV